MKSSVSKPIQVRALWPGVLAFVAGLAMLAAHHLSLLHVMLHSASGMLFCFGFCTLSLLYSLWRDFREQAQLVRDIALCLAAVVISICVQSLFLKWMLAVYSVSLFLYVFCVKRASADNRFLLHVQLLLIGSLGGVVAGFSVTASLGVIALCGFWKIGHLSRKGLIKGQISVKSSILISVLVAWTCSTLSLFLPSVFSFGVFFHDSLLAVGAYQIGQYFRDRYRDQLLGSGDTYPLLKDKKTNSYIRVQNVEVGKRYTVDAEAYLPFPVATSCCAKGWYEDANAERRVVINGRTEIPKNVRFHLKSGTFEAKAGFPKSCRNRAVGHDAEIFLLFVILLSLVAGVIWAWVNASIMSGFSQFALSVMGACPCVFVFSRPIIEIQAMRQLERLGIPLGSQQQGYIWRKKVDIAVFDRTGTLMHQDESEPGGDYVAKEGIREMFTRLRKMGVQVFILSGHGGEGSDVSENVLSDRKTQMVNLIGGDEHRVHFGLSSEDKARYVRALQRTGTLDGNQPPSPATVLFVGDEANDHPSLEIADVAIAVGHNHDSQVRADMRMSVEDVKKVPDFLKVITNTAPWISRITYAAYAYNLMMLFMANGGAMLLFGVQLQISFACLAMMAFSISTLFYVSRFNLSELGGQSFRQFSHASSYNVLGPSGLEGNNGLLNYSPKPRDCCGGLNNGKYFENIEEKVLTS